MERRGGGPTLDFSSKLRGVLIKFHKFDNE